MPLSVALGLLLAVGTAFVSILGFLFKQRGAAEGDAVGVIALTSAAANLSTIAAGLVVFGEPLPGGGLAMVLRLVAFALVIGAAALTPGPRIGSAA